MSKAPNQTKKDKARASPRPPSRSDNEPPTLTQLKTTIETNPGAVRNASEARNYLENRNYLLKQQQSSNTSLATILLSLVVPTGPRTTTDRIHENVANVIKAVALLLEEATIATYVEQITKGISQNISNTEGPHNETTAKILQNNSDFLKAISTKHLETIERTNALAEKIEKLQENTAAQTSTQGPTPISFRDALMGNTRGVSSSTPNTPLEARLRNRLNIKSCQIMVEIQSTHQDPLKAAYPDGDNPIDKLRQAANTWISLKSDNMAGLPDNSNIRSIKQYHAYKFLIETNRSETADWIKKHPETLSAPFKNPVKILNRLYPVIARFMPTHFQTDPAGLRELEINAKLDPQSITHATWIKDPKRRNPDQKHANIKIYCETPETANALIMNNPQHLGTQLRIHKVIRAPGTCLNCQQYGHYATNCKETTPTCGKCADTHLTSECKSDRLKCTPCGSVNHQTNDPTCSERQNREAAILTKDVEALSPYYSTVERWTWSLEQEDTQPELPSAPHRRTTRTAPFTRHTRQPQRARQNTLFGSGFQRQPTQSGANSTPIGNPRQRGAAQPTPVPPARTSDRPSAQGNTHTPQPEMHNTAQTATQPPPESHTPRASTQHSDSQNDPNPTSSSSNQ